MNLTSSLQVNVYCHITCIRFGFYDIHNKQGPGNNYQPQPSALAYNSYLDLD